MSLESKDTLEKQVEKTVTLYDVARYVGYSSATCSLALKDDKRIKSATRLKIQEAAKKLNYKPNVIAIALSERKSRNIGVVVPELTNPVFSEIVAGLEKCLFDNNYYPIIGVTNLVLEKEKKYLNMLLHQRVDGLVIMPTFLKELEPIFRQMEEENLPFVLAGVPFADKKVNYVTSNMVEGAYLAIEHLIQKGHKNIAFISYVTTNQQNEERLIGYREALDIYGIPFDPEHVLLIDQNKDDILLEVDLFLERHPDVTAIFCLYDYMAMPIMKAIMNRGLRIPEDVALIGYDNIKISDYFPVSLSTIDSNNYKVGELSARVILSLVENGNDTVYQQTLVPSLIVRDST